MNLVIMIIALALFSMLIYSLVVTCDKKEGWVDYKQFPYGNIQSGAGNNDSTPVSFYDYPSYRKPMNWPICHLVDYPVPHCRADSL
uniref:Uncharacterized protein n=1 Tax=viral metagenome TaxID=1070528 RepID=A0A6C0EZ78_9ZZZZ